MHCKLAAGLFQNDRDTQLVAYAPDRFDRAFCDLTMRVFEFFSQTADQLFHRVFVHGWRILVTAKEVAQRPRLQGAVLGLDQGDQEYLFSVRQPNGLF